MLKELRIKNLAIIDDLTVSFEKGLNVLTGETGAGKSIIVDALGLALGDRAQTELIKSGEKEATVQAYFEIDDPGGLPDIDVDISEGIILRRIITAGGKSRAYINDLLVTLQTLSEIGKSLVDIHSQHEHQSLLSPEKQRTLLDSFGKFEQERQKVESLFNEVRDLKKESDELRKRAKERAHRIDLLRFQVNEIDTACLKKGEKEILEDERRLLVNHTKLNELIETSYSLLYESDNSCIEKLSRATKLLRDMQGIDNSIGEIVAMLEAAAPLVEDAAGSLRGYKDKYDFEPGRLDLVEERLELIKGLERKYGENTEEILKYKEDAVVELNSLETSDERQASLDKELRSKEAELLNAAQRLSEKRKDTAVKIEEFVEGILKDLAFGTANFKIDIKQETGEDGKIKISSHGIDKIEFLFSANAGEPLKPLLKIVSGGELSRVMLALKNILAEVDSIPVLIFDEVDAGIGGKTAESVGRKLEMISRKHQLLCITHLPQIASLGDFHLKIEKRQRNNKVCVEVKELSGKERQEEIARMLSGTVTEISRKHAGELLERVK